MADVRDHPVHVAEEVIRTHDNDRPAEFSCGVTTTVVLSALLPVPRPVILHRQLMSRVGKIEPGDESTAYVAHHTLSFRRRQAGSDES